jgi:hypothetical protein
MSDNIRIAGFVIALCGHWHYDRRTVFCKTLAFRCAYNFQRLPRLSSNSDFFLRVAWESESVNGRDNLKRLGGDGRVKLE